MLSGKSPYWKVQDFRVSATIMKGKKPSRPGQDGTSGEEISDTIWRPTSMCWETEPDARPCCSEVQAAFACMDIHDDRPIPQPIIPPEVVKRVEALPLGLGRARTILSQIIGSDHSMPPLSQIPEHLQELVSGLADNFVKADAVAVAAKKLNPNDTQAFVDVLDLVSFFLSPSLEKRSLMRYCSRCGKRPTPLQPLIVLLMCYLPRS
jgi:hypothetical protein